jgi:hypothetical protein
MRRIGTAVVAALAFLAVVLVPGSAGARVSSTSAPTPQLATSGTDGSIEEVVQLTQCGQTMYAVGAFTLVRNAGQSALITRNNAFAFSAVAPYRVTNWNPNVNGRVETVACGTDGSVFLGGSFSNAGGAANRNLAKVNATTGASMAFSFHPAGRVQHVEVVRDAANVLHLLVGGYFTGLLDSRNPVTGADDGYGTPAFSGTYQFEGVSGHSPRVHNMSVYPAPYQQGSTTVNPAVLLTGVFTSVGGQHHEQVVRLNLTAGAATVSPWTPTELFAHCIGRQPFYAQDAAWAPDMSRIYVVTTGFRLASEQALPPAQRPQARTGPCDATIAYPTAENTFNGHTWINYTGCDSLYSVAADAETVYSGGHQRWVSNGNGCDRQGPGARFQPGLSEVDATNGAYQPGPDRGRGLGAKDLLRTSAGLWIASDNQANTARCAGTANRMGICFLPNN